MSRLALVTGASSGIGDAYAERLAGDGWNLVVTGRRLERLEKLARRLTDEHGVSVDVRRADLGDPGDLAGLVSEVSALPLELLVNNAGLAHYSRFAELSPQSAEQLVDVNALAPVLLTRAVLPGMLERGSGSIVNVASLLAFSGGWEAPHLPQRAVYAATKSFLVTFTQIVAAEVRDSGVRLQVVCPGMARTEFHSRQGLDVSAVQRMEPADVVAASLLDLERGTLVSIPGADDDEAFAAVEAAQAGLAGFTRTVTLPERYQG